MIARSGKVSDIGIEDILKFICEFVCELLDQQNLISPLLSETVGPCILLGKKIQRADLV